MYSAPRVAEYSAPNFSFLPLSASFNHLSSALLFKMGGANLTFKNSTLESFSKFVLGIS